MTDEAAALDESSLVTVARFGNAAEAGYFADALEAEQSIRTVLTSVDDFDAMKGNWAAVIHLRVAPHDAARAKVALRELLADSSGAGEFDPGSRTRVFGPAMSVGSWNSIIVSFAAGAGLVFFGLYEFENRVPPPGGVRNLDQLVAELGAAGEPWVQGLEKGGRRELHAAKGGDIVLREDRDGDGTFERTETYLSSTPR